MNVRRLRVLLMIGLLVISASVVYAIRQTHSGVNSFEECRSAGYETVGSDPRQCISSDGSIFREPVDQE